MWVLKQFFLALVVNNSFGFSEKELVKVYTTNVRPLVEYCAVVFHSQMTDEQDELLERQQNHALKIIYGLNISAGKMRETAGLTTLRQRRIHLCDKFAEKAAASDRFKSWFPLKRTSRATRSTDRYLETHARCDRLKNSPVFFMRRRLNGKPGKTYGKRNQFWRER